MGGFGVGLVIPDHPVNVPTSTVTTSVSFLVVDVTSRSERTVVDLPL